MKFSLIILLLYLVISGCSNDYVDYSDEIDALENDKLSFAALDTFENEPKPAVKVLMNSKVSLTPHIGAATSEAQDRIGTELASQIIEILK